jgi:hypothetical protein
MARTDPPPAIPETIPELDVVVVGGSQAGLAMGWLDGLRTGQNGGKGQSASTSVAS